MVQNGYRYGGQPVAAPEPSRKLAQPILVSTVAYAAIETLGLARFERFELGSMVVERTAQQPAQSTRLPLSLGQSGWVRDAG